jgi:hypothetical protein
MKKLLLLTLALVSTVSAFAQNQVSATLANGATTYLLSTNRLRVYSIETTTTNAVTFKIWDNDNTNNVPTAATTGWWGTNFVNGAYISRSTYATNLATSYVSPVGFTNWYTNAGIWSVTTTNAAGTNAVVPAVTVANGGAETRVTYANLILARGAVVTSTGNGTVTLYYSPE